jgi:hypothetical protein
MIRALGMYINMNINMYINMNMYMYMNMKMNMNMNMNMKGQRRDRDDHLNSFRVTVLICHHFPYLLNNLTIRQNT